MMITAQVLGVEVDEALIERWRDWFAPSTQPFRIDTLPPEVTAAVPMRKREPTSEWQDTFFMYGGTWTWLNEDEFNALRPGLRRSLLAVRRRTGRPKSMPVWPSELARSGDQALFAWVASSVRPSQHREVPAHVWRRTPAVLPQAEHLSGTFPTSGSGANCFGAVLAAAGVPGTTDVQIGTGQLQAWLDEHTEPITGTGSDDQPGVVFTWTEHDKLAHAAVSIGDGWMFSKPSQAWCSPRLIWSVRQTINSWRYPTSRLSRRWILRGAS